MGRQALSVGPGTLSPHDLEVFYEQQREEEAVRRAQFPARDRDRSLTHWRTKALGNTTGHAKTVTVDGEVSGKIVAW